MESLSDPSSWLGVVAACYTREYFSLIVSLQFGVQSHHSSTVYVIQSHHVTLSVRRSEPLLVFHSTFRAVVHPCWAFKAISLVLVFRAIIPFQFGVQSHCVFSFTMFRVVFLSMTFLVTSLVGHAELLFQIGIHRCFFWFGVQSHHYRIPSFGVRSHHHFLVWRSWLHSLFRRSKSSSHLRSAFRAIIITSQYRCSEPSSSHFQFRRSEPCFHSYMEFRAIVYFRFGVQSNDLFLFGVQSHIFVLTFRAIAYLRFIVQSRVSIPTWRSEPLPIFILAFRAVFCFCLAFWATSSF